MATAFKSAVQNLSIALFGVRAKYWWAGSKGSGERDDLADISGVVAALLGPVAPGEMCPYPGRFASHRVQSAALTPAAVGDTLHRTAQQALIYDTDQKRASKPDIREKAVSFTVHASLSCGAQSQPLRDWVVNLRDLRNQSGLSRPKLQRVG